jgi:hypothetical protein
MSEFDTLKNEYDSLPDLEQRLVRYSRIMFDLSLPGQIRKHEHTYTHYKKLLTSCIYEYTRIKGNDILIEKIDTMIDKVDKIRELENKREK